MTRSPSRDDLIEYFGGLRFISVPFDHLVPPTRCIPESAKAKIVSALRSRQRPTDVQALQRLTSMGSVSYLHQICRALAIDGRVNVFRKINAGQIRFYKLAEQDEAGYLFASDAPAPADEEQPEDVADDGTDPAENALGGIADALRSLEDLPEASSADLQSYGFRLEELDQLKDAVVNLARRASVRLAELRAARALEIVSNSNDDDGHLPQAVQTLISIHYSIRDLRSYLGSA